MLGKTNLIATKEVFDIAVSNEGERKGGGGGGRIVVKTRLYIFICKNQTFETG